MGKNQKMFLMYLLPLMLLLENSQNLPTSDSCPDIPGIVNGGSSCYLVSHVKMTWGEAQEFCYEKKGFLAEITTREEDNLLDTILAEDLHYWIGLSDWASEGTWVWQDSHQKADYTNWRPGQPEGEGDCAFKSYWDGNPRWWDYPCNDNIWHQTIHALCEFI